MVVGRSPSASTAARSVIKKSGVKSHDKVAVICENSAQFMMVFLAVFQLMQAWYCSIRNYHLPQWKKCCMVQMCIPSAPMEAAVLKWRKSYPPAKRTRFVFYMKKRGIGNRQMTFFKNQMKCVVTQMKPPLSCSAPAHLEKQMASC